MIETERLILRPPTHADARAIAEGIGEWEVASRLSTVPFPYAVEDAHHWIDQILRERAAGEKHVLLVQPKQSESTSIIGCIGLKPKADEPALADFRYWLAKKHWGLGYATEAGTVLRDQAFINAGFDLLTASALVDNLASIHVLRKLGFQGDETSKGYALTLDAEVEVLKVKLTRDRWLSIRSELI
jgi:RimJ/RimL family protein N-acetyltransferase